MPTSEPSVASNRKVIQPMSEALSGAVTLSQNAVALLATGGFIAAGSLSSAGWLGGLRLLPADLV